MAVAQEFRNAVQEEDLMMVRIMLKDSLVGDPTFKGFNELLAYAKGHLAQIYEEHDGEVLNEDEAVWTKAYMDQQMVVVVGNFSRERVELLRKIVTKLYGQRAKAIEQRRRDEKRGAQTTISRRQVGTGLSVGGAAIAVVGLCVSEGIVAAVGVGAAIAGAAILMTEK